MIGNMLVTFLIKNAENLVADNKKFNRDKPRIQSRFNQENKKIMSEMPKNQRILGLIETRNSIEINREFNQAPSFFTLFFPHEAAVERQFFCKNFMTVRMKI
jgi:hypothetical protein